MSNAEICTIPSSNKNIIKKVCADSKDALYCSFAQKFLSYVPVDYTNKNSPETFAELTRQAFEFYKKRDKRRDKIAAQVSTHAGNPAILISLLTVDKPFIIDSISALLARRGIKPKFIIHPVMGSIRDSSGKLVEICDKSARGCTWESLVIVKILGNFTKQNLAELEKEFASIYERIEIVQSSAGALGKQVKDIEENLEETKTHIISRGKATPQLEININEAICFVKWLQDNHFTFLSIGEFDTSGKMLSSTGLSEILTDARNQATNIIAGTMSDSNANDAGFLGKIYCNVVVRERRSVDLVVLKHFGHNAKCDKIILICGLYSPAIYHQSIKNIPILRRKMQHMLGKSSFSKDGYNIKKSRDIIESIPRAALIQLESETLYCMSLHILSSMLSLRVKTFIQQKGEQYINVLIFMPRHNVTVDTYSSILKYLQESFKGKPIYEDRTDVGQNFSYLFFTLEISGKQEYDAERIDRKIRNIARSWDEDFDEKLIALHGEYKAGIEYKNYRDIFPADYKHRFSPGRAVHDLDYLIKTSEHDFPEFNISQKSEKKYILKVYSKEAKLPLSNILPLIENIGFKAINEQSFFIAESAAISNCWLHSINLELDIELKGDFEELKCKIEESLNKVSRGELAIDKLSSLITLCSFNWAEVRLVRALSQYLHQTGFQYGREYIQKSLVRHYSFSKLLKELFFAKFSPDLKKARKKNIDKINKQVQDALADIKDRTIDTILRSMWHIVKSVTRTNFFLSQASPKDYVSFKIDSRQVPHMPAPVPFTEIFVYAKKFEGIYISGGKVARGGLRWSDRTEDYRTEVLGLMKAQMTKNTVIVPVGSKGGFVLHDDISQMSYEDKQNTGVACYKNFLRGMLDIVDNNIDGKIVAPENVICYDEPYPYLVVAADKGTARFSDYANEIAAEYNFWLSDAFASGGSAGYDHKKMAITAKGAWIAAQLHCKKLGLNPQIDNITVAGIGDMSGDVFGNGMLLSKSIKLVAAFDHRDIFIDPSPDPASSYVERMRLFKLSRSSWQDYDRKLISRGGGVFSRSAKSIAISTQIKKLLSLRAGHISSTDLIKAILRADVDLIWNGGIGTYIKSSGESNNDIGDRSNDRLRSNGRDIRAKMVAEGGNLGLSQMGRIEYSKSGGLVNTDFIDNAAGVSCSDHEVNIKIALTSALSSKKITLAQRNKLMVEMTSEVERLVLDDIGAQMQSLSIWQSMPSSNVNNLSRLIHFLESENLLNREVEFLPSDETLKRMAQSGQTLTRPELAVLLSYSKMAVYDEIISAKLIDDDWFDSYLMDYFPSSMQKSFKKEILNHPLRREIISTIITSKVVNKIGGESIYTIRKEIGGDICDIVRAYIITCHVFGLDALWNQVEKISAKAAHKTQVELFGDLVKIMRRGISWFLKNIQRPIDIKQNIARFEQQVGCIAHDFHSFLPRASRLKFEKKKSHLTSLGIDSTLAGRIASLEHMVSAFDIVYVKEHCRADAPSLARDYFILGERLMLDDLRRYCDALIKDAPYWRRLSMQAIKDDIYERQRRLMLDIGVLPPSAGRIEIWIASNKRAVDGFLDFAAQLKRLANIDQNMVILANKKLAILLHKVELSGKK